MCILGDIGMILSRDLLRFYRIGIGCGIGEWASFCRNLLGLWDMWEIGGDTWKMKILVKIVPWRKYRLNRGDQLGKLRAWEWIS